MHQSETKRKIEFIKNDYFLRRCVSGTLPHLSKTERAILSMRIYKGMTLEDVAFTISKPMSFVSYHELAAIRRLARIKATTAKHSKSNVTKAIKTSQMSLASMYARNVDIRKRMLAGEEPSKIGLSYNLTADTVRMIGNAWGTYSYLGWRPVEETLAVAACMADDCHCEERAESPIKRLLSPIGRLFGWRG